ncbi:MAG: bifunctional lysylphosphatidylglycerol flippase/synthetase MprF [Pseudomonadota bacterium]
MESESRKVQAEPDGNTRADDLTNANSGQARLHWVRRVLPVAFLAIVATLAARELRGLDLHAVRTVLHDISLPRLLMIQSAAIAGVLAMSLYDWRAARAFQLELPLGTLVRTAWIANAFNNLIGLSGLAGSGIRLLLFGSAGIDTGRAAAVSALIMASVPVGLAVLCWPLLLTGGPGIDRLPVPAWMAWSALAVFAAYLPVYLLTLHRGLFTRLLQGLAPQSAATLAMLVIISTLDWLIAAATAWLAFEISGASIAWLPFLAGFVLASTLGILSLIPGGLGVFDTALVVLLAPWARSPEHLVSGILVYRLCYYVMPWLIAVYLGADRLMLPQHWEQLPIVRQWRDSRLTGLLRLPLNMLASLGVHALAYLTFAGGVILLVSAAFPTLSDRLVVLKSYVPLAAIEISHTLSVAAGALLIALARGIAAQVRSAYHLTQILLVTGALFTFIKGFDFEEAIALLTVTLLLSRQRTRFYRASYPLFSARSLLWLAGLVIAIAGFAWLGSWVHGGIPLGWTHLSRFAHNLDAPRFARGLVIAMAAVIAWFGWSFFRQPKTISGPADAQTLAEAEVVLNRDGGSEFAHLVFLGDKSLVWTPDRRAFVQYGRIRDRLVALGDPCGAPDAFDAAIIAFRDFADLHDLRPCFYEISDTHVHRFHDAGFALFKLGETALVRLAEFTTAGKRGESLRHSANRARREGAVFELLAQPLEPALWPELRAISDSWLAAHRTAEKGFSLGSYRESYLRRSPVAVIRIGTAVVAFANLMPDYGSRTTLSIDLMRHSPQAPPGTMDLLFVELIQHAQAEGYRYFSLGMAPLGGVGETRYARTGEKIARLAYEYGNRLYNYKGLRSFKDKYHPEWHSAYLAYPVLTPLPGLLLDTTALIAGGYRRIFTRSD